MRCAGFVLGILACGLVGGPALAHTGAAAAVQPAVTACGDGAFGATGGGFSIGCPAQTRATVLARLDEQRFRVSNDTAEGEADGGKAMAGAAGGIGN